MPTICLKCGATKGRRTPKPAPCTTKGCTGEMIRIQKQLLPVAQAFYSAGYPVCGADSYVYSLERNDLIMRVRVAFSVKLSSDAFPELPTRCCFSQGVFGAVEYCCVECDALYLTECGEMLYTKQAARRKAANTLYDYAVWLENSGMSSVLVLQGKL